MPSPPYLAKCIPSLFFFLVALCLAKPSLADYPPAIEVENGGLAPSTTPSQDDQGTMRAATPTQSSFMSWQKVWGEPAPTSLYLGMVTLHINPNSRDDNWNNQLIAVAVDGYFADTLVNSFYDRAYDAGIQRTFFTRELSSNVNESMGYRLGLISGYDKRMASFAEHTPLLPFPQLLYDLSWQHVGVELSWCLVTASAGLFYRF